MTPRTSGRPPSESFADHRCENTTPWRFSMNWWGCKHCGAAWSYWGDRARFPVPWPGGESMQWPTKPSGEQS